MEGERQALACFRTRVASMPLARINHALQSLRKILHADRVSVPGQVRALSCNPTAWQILIKHSPFPYHHFPRKSTTSQSETWPPRYEQCCLFPGLGGQSPAPALYLRCCGGFWGGARKNRRRCGWGLLSDLLWVSPAAAALTTDGQRHLRVIANVKCRPFTLFVIRNALRRRWFFIGKVKARKSYTEQVIGHVSGVFWSARMIG